MSSNRGQKDHPQPDQGTTVSAMLGGRVRKRRIGMASELPSKRAKTATTVVPAPIPKAKVAPSSATPAEPKPTAEPSPAKTNTPGSSKSMRQLRLSELLKRDRQRRFQLTAPPPRIIRTEPHMDSRRPRPYSGASSTPTKRIEQDASLKSKVLPNSPVTHRSATPTKPPVPRDVKHLPIPTKLGQTESEISFVTSSSLASTRIRSSGSEAIIYSRAMLPASHTLLLDIFAGIETATTLLRTRKELSTFASVRPIVANSSKRQFTFRHLSQLAHLVPEALCVLPCRNPRLTGRDHLILRLDNVEADKLDKASKKSFASFVGGNATRTRRRLLHDRLLQHVREHHSVFLEKKGITSHESHMWHDDFDLESDVPQLGAPPLYPVSPPTTKDESKARPSANEPIVVPKRASPRVVPPTEVKSNEKESVDRSSTPESDSSCIPTSLLEKVRARSRARNEMAEAKAADYRTKPDYIERLPGTMDTVASIFRADKRHAFGWNQLVMRLVKQHPRNWPEDEIERQLNSIVDLATEWCSKVKLGGSKVRFAFRILDEKKFTAQRAKVVASLHK